MDWLIFGDDFGNHPSTTQHLAINLPEEDRIIWINSLGMRTPGFNFRDLSRMANKGLASMQAILKSGRSCERMVFPPNITVIHPLVLPWHTNVLVRRYNRCVIQGVIRKTMAAQGMDTVMVLAAYPYAVLYITGLPCSGMAYLRLDDYPNLPGMNSRMAHSTERVMFRRADWVFATAEGLLPSAEDTPAQLVYLPQGVDVSHFATVSGTPPKQRILGFYGLMAEWIDFELATRVAHLLPEWTLEFVGPARHIPEWFGRVDNIRLHPGIDYKDLPRLMQNWDAAWIPFRVDDMTRGVNPIKLREYLAAGLPTLSTPLPEAEKLTPHIEISDDPRQIKTWLEKVFSTDDAQSRDLRKRSILEDSWSSRVRQLRETVCAGRKNPGELNPG